MARRPVIEQRPPAHTAKPPGDRASNRPSARRTADLLTLPTPHNSPHRISPTALPPKGDATAPMSSAELELRPHQKAAVTAATRTLQTHPRASIDSICARPLLERIRVPRTGLGRPAPDPTRWLPTKPTVLAPTCDDAASRAPSQEE